MRYGNHCWQPVDTGHIVARRWECISCGMYYDEQNMLFKYWGTKNSNKIFQCIKTPMPKTCEAIKMMDALE